MTDKDSNKSPDVSTRRVFMQHAGVAMAGGFVAAQLSGCDGGDAPVVPATSPDSSAAPPGSARSQRAV